ncbi:hypothetical protein QZH41_018721 [Actinostola sp. cb2023]|nr:hypothetical protein QZH41_018721 [Actinostola sp. cb2023]
MTIIFSWFYIRYYQDNSLSEVSSTITGIVALVIALLTSALVPVDIFLVSYMKNTDGTWKSWSSNSASRDELESAVDTSYYVLYGLLAFLIFLIIPFMYFYFEEKDEDVTTSERICSATKYSIGFLIVAGVLLLVGAFAPLKQPPKNITQWDQKLIFLKDELGANKGETALSLLIGFLALIGMMIMITYTAYGMTALPFAMLKGFKGARKEHENVSERLEENKERARMIRAKYMAGRSINGRDRRTLSRLESEEHTLIRQERRLENAQLGWLNKCLKCCRPFEVVFGIFYLLFALLLVVSLFITCLDKALHSEGYKYGYVLPKSHLQNPINIIMVQAQKLGTRVCCKYIIMLFSLAPEYVMYGSQHYALGTRVCYVWQSALCCKYIIMLFSLAPEYVMYGSQHYALGTRVCYVWQSALCSWHQSMLCMAVSIMLLAPEYVMYGSQHYALGTRVCYVSIMVVSIMLLAPEYVMYGSQHYAQEHKQKNYDPTQAGAQAEELRTRRKQEHKQKNYGPDASRSTSRITTDPTQAGAQAEELRTRRKQEHKQKNYGPDASRSTSRRTTDPTQAGAQAEELRTRRKQEHKQKNYGPDASLSTSRRTTDPTQAGAQAEELRTRRKQEHKQKNYGPDASRSTSRRTTDPTQAGAQAESIMLFSRSTSRRTTDPTQAGAQAEELRTRRKQEHKQKNYGPDASRSASRRTTDPTQAGAQAEELRTRRKQEHKQKNYGPDASRSASRRTTDPTQAGAQAEELRTRRKQERKQKNYGPDASRSTSRRTTDPTQAGAQAQEMEIFYDCTVTRIAVFLHRFFYKVWFFGACYYWGTWIFLAAFVIGLVVSIVRKRKTVVEEYFSDSDDSEEEMA